MKFKPKPKVKKTEHAKNSQKKTDMNWHRKQNKAKCLVLSEKEICWQNL